MIRPKVIFAALALCAFSAPAYAAESFNLTDVVRLPPEKLAAGLARAEAAGDYGAATAQCLKGVIAYNAANPPKAVIPKDTVDPVDAAVAAHLIANGLAVGTVELFPFEIRNACGGLALEVLRNVNAAGLKAAPAAAKFLGIF